MTTPANRFPVFEELTVQQVREYLARRQSIIIPIGVTEQHGYHLPLSTDSLIATHLARRTAERLGMLVAPTFTNCFSGGTLPGTINYSPAVMALAMGDMLSSLAAQGFRNFYLFICHGGSENLRALRLPNLHLLFGDGMQGYAKGAPYAAIISAAGGESVPQAWLDQLAVGGRLVAPVVVPAAGVGGGANTQALLVVDKTPQGFKQTLLEAVHFVPLKSGLA